MFFLGAGFMLLETKGVVQMALLFGSTWMVNSIIFFAILVMILLSNLFVIVFKPKKRWGIYYGLLAVAPLAQHSHSDGLLPEPSRNRQNAHLVLAGLCADLLCGDHLRGGFPR